MAFFHGKTALVKVVSTAIETTIGWALNTTQDIVDTTAMGDTWKTHENGFYDFSATVEGYARTERTTVSDVGVASEDLLLYIGASNYFTADDAICTSITESVEKDDVGKISYSFEGDDSTGLAYT